MRLTSWIKWDATMSGAISLVPACRKITLCSSSNVLAWLRPDRTKLTNLELRRKRAERELWERLSRMISCGKAASLRFCRCSSRKFGPWPTSLPSCQTLSNWLRILACACRPQLGPGSSQAPSIDHLLCPRYQLWGMDRRKTAQQ